MSIMDPKPLTVAAANATYLPGDKTGAADGHVATWDAAAGKFKPKPPAASGVSQFDATGATVASVNTWLAASSPLGVKKLVGTLSANAPIVLPSGTYADFTTAVINSTVAGNIVQNKAVATSVRAVSDAAMTAGSTTLTSATAAFTSADIGRSVVVADALAAGNPVTANIVSVTDASNVVLSVAAVATVSAKTATIYDRDSNIILIGGTFNRGGNGGTGVAAHSLVFRRVDDLLIRNVTVTSSGGKYAINLGDCNRFTVDSPTFNTSSDGVHMNGPCSAGLVQNVKGKTGDDAVAMTATDYGVYTDVAGPITDIIVRNTIADTGNTVATKLTSGPGTYLDRILIDGVHQLNASGIAVGFADDTGALDARRISVKNLIGSLTTNVTSGTIQSLDVENIRRDHGASNSSLLSITCAVQDMVVRGARGVAPAGATGNHLLTINGTGNIARLTLRDVRHVGQSANTIHLSASGATVTDATLSGLNRDGLTSSGSVVNAATTGTVIGRVKISDTVVTNTAWIADVAGTGIAFHLSNLKHPAGFNVRATANLTVYAEACEIGSHAVAAGGVFRSKSLGFTADLATLAKNNGDLAYNTNAALSSGVGPSVCNGTNWKNLYTGTTY